MTVAKGYLLDANVFIEAHKRYYAFDICPGYWAALVSNHAKGHLCSIDRVRQELVGQGDALSQWADGLAASFFAATGDPSVTAMFGSVMTWVQAQPQYLPAAKAAFAAKADGWLVAYAKVQGFVAATDEVPNPGTRKKVPIPNICDAFGVEYVGTFDLLRALGATFQ
jgi:hypothetical protein